MNPYNLAEVDLYIDNTPINRLEFFSHEHTTSAESRKDFR
jgi:hypothetical protein